MRLTKDKRTILIMRSMQGGPIAYDALKERMGGYFPTGIVDDLCKSGAVEAYQDGHLGQAYRLTAAGRAKLPSRREAAAMEVAA